MSVRSLLAPTLGIVAALAANGSADTPKAPPPPPPPSTGKELQIKTNRPSIKDAQAIMTAALAEAKKPNPNCALVANSKVRVSWFALPLPTKQDLIYNQEAYVGFARCAEKQRFYALQKDIGLALVKAKDIHPELVVRALIGLKAYKTAMTLLTAALKQYPKDANLLVTAAKLECMADKWKDCVNHAASADDNAAKLDKSEKLAIQSRAYKYGARAALHLGAPDKAAVFADKSEKLGGDKGDLAEIKSLITQAKVQGALVEPEVDAELPLGVYHLYGKLPDAGSLVRILVTNVSGKDAQYKAEVSIDGVTQKQIQTLTIGKNQSKAAMFNPPLVPGFDAGKIRAATAGQVTIKITASSAGAPDKVVYEQTHPINLQPRDYLPTVSYDGADSEHRIPWTYAAWITPNAKSIDAFLAKAKARHPKATFSGEQSDTFIQVKAIYEELQAEGMSYVMDPDVMSNEGFGQRTRLPTEILTSTNAQCLEGTLLYATLFEAIGLRPVIVRVPGHAFVGWRPSDKDPLKAKLANGIYFLETTATHSAKFEQAVDYAMGEFKDHDGKKEATVVDIAALRKAGVTPQPID